MVIKLQRDRVLSYLLDSLSDSYNTLANESPRSDFKCALDKSSYKDFYMRRKKQRIEELYCEEWRHNGSQAMTKKEWAKCHLCNLDRNVLNVNKLKMQVRRNRRLSIGWGETKGHLQFRQWEYWISGLPYPLDCVLMGNPSHVQQWHTYIRTMQ